MLLEQGVPPAVKDARFEQFRLKKFGSVEATSPQLVVAVGRGRPTAATRI